MSDETHPPVFFDRLNWSTVVCIELRRKKNEGETWYRLKNNNGYIFCLLYIIWVFLRNCYRTEMLKLRRFFFLTRYSSKSYKTGRFTNALKNCSFFSWRCAVFLTFYKWYVWLIIFVYVDADHDLSRNWSGLVQNVYLTKLGEKIRILRLLLYFLQTNEMGKKWVYHFDAGSAKCWCYCILIVWMSFVCECFGGFWVHGKAIHLFFLIH